MSVVEPTLFVEGVRPKRYWLFAIVTPISIPQYLLDIIFKVNGVEVSSWFFDFGLGLTNVDVDGVGFNFSSSVATVDINGSDLLGNFSVTVSVA